MPMRWLHALLLVLVTSAALSAQEQGSLDEFISSFDAGLEALRSGQHDEGLAAFERCLVLIPEDAGTAYNMACGYALKGDVDEAFAWLERGAAWGVGNTAAERQLLFTDPDLTELRADARFAAIVAAVSARRAALAAFAASPAVYIPDALQDSERLPLLVVLHDYGETKDSVVAGPWRAVADRLGLALLAPSGPNGTAVDPADGMGWFLDPAKYGEAPWLAEQTANDAVQAFRAEHVVDRERVFIAGVGQGGTVAMGMALVGPGFYKGVLSLDGPPVDSLVPPAAPDAARLGLRLELRIDFGLDAATAQQVAADFASRFASWGLAGNAQPWSRATDDDLIAAAVIGLTALGATDG